ncbi:MAG: hypothetical protein GY754_06790 [bacterium]|nr:hypothetical protein [bacterium]
MKFLRIILLFLMLLGGPFLVSAQAAPTMGFGYLSNKSVDYNFDYLETIFPNSFANSIQNIFEVRVVKPTTINERLKKYKEELKKEYELHELPGIAKKLDLDFFIFGNFTPLANDNIKIVLYLYAKESNRIFSFTNIGKMETEIFKLVDRITMILVNFMKKEQLYLSKVIPGGSRLAILTNLNNAEMNALYYGFLTKGYRVSSFQANLNKNIVSEKGIDVFKHVYTRNNSYDIITDKKRVKFLRGTWSGGDYDEHVSYLMNVYQVYDQKYPETKERILGKLSSSYKGSIDYLLIIGFNGSRSSAWVRAIDLKRKDLVWMQANISGSSIHEISGKMIKRMSTRLAAPFKKK